jgi:anaerobic selenocysteine-containing dehydrogenase
MLVTVESGRAIRVSGDPEHPFTRGFLCAKVNRYVERTYHEDRLLHPMRRTGPKGSGNFVRISWDEALDEIAARLNEIRASGDGPQSILPYSYAGTMGIVQGSSIDRRFFHAIGASKLDRTICSMAGTIGMRMTLGANVGADPEGIPQSDLVLLWGTNTLTSNPHLWPFVLEAKARGAPIIAIDPIRTRTAACTSFSIAGCTTRTTSRATPSASPSFANERRSIRRNASRKSPASPLKPSCRSASDTGARKRHSFG